MVGSTMTSFVHKRTSSPKKIVCCYYLGTKRAPVGTAEFFIHIFLPTFVDFTMPLEVAVISASIQN